MTISPTATIAGYSLIQIRRFLRRHPNGHWTYHAVMRDLRLSQDDASALVEALHQDGYIETDGTPNPFQCWKSTDLGTKLAAAHAARPISRATATRKLNDLIGRAHQVNSDNQLAYRVRRITVIGSYLTDAPTLSDVDVVISLAPRLTDRAAQESLMHERRCDALDSGRRFRNYSEELCWPEDEVLLFLKSRSRALQLVSEHAAFLSDCPKRTVFESNDAAS